MMIKKKRNAIRIVKKSWLLKEKRNKDAILAKIKNMNIIAVMEMEITAIVIVNMGMSIM